VTRQLTYACFGATPGVAGGWRIGQRSDELRPELADGLLRHLPAPLPEDQNMPTFPTPAQLSDRARRLCFGRSGVESVFWHTASAGVDASGRPGNAFTHIAALSVIEMPDKWIPIHAWRSPSWAVPYGAQEVDDARLMPGFPDAGPYAEPDRIVDFLAVSGRKHIWAMLLDGLYVNLRVRRPIAVICDSADEAAGWVASLTSMVGIDVAREVSFGVWIQAPDVGSVAPHYALMCVDRASIPPGFATSERLLVIDPRRSTEFRMVEDGHFTWEVPGVAPVPGSTCSEVALDAFDSGQLRACLAAVSHGKERASFMGDFGGVLSQGDPSDVKARGLIDAGPYQLADSGAAQEPDLIPLISQALREGKFSEIPDLAARTTAAQIESGRFDAAIAGLIDHLGRELHHRDRPGVTGSILQFGNAASALSRKQQSLKRNQLTPLLQAVVPALFNQSGPHLAGILSRCSSEFIQEDLAPAIDLYLRSNPEAAAAELSPAIAWSLTHGLGLAFRWRAASHPGLQTPLEAFLRRSTFRVTGAPLPFAHPGTYPGSAARPIGTASSFAVAEMDWMLSESGGGAQELWASEAFVGSIDWPLGSAAKEWATEALRVYAADICDARVKELLTVYTAVDDQWWKRTDWPASAWHLLTWKLRPSGIYPRQLLVEVATAVLMVAIASDPRLPPALERDARAFHAVREVALVCAGAQPHVALLGARQALPRLLELAGQTVENDEPWGSRLAWLIEVGSRAVDQPFNPDALAALLELPLPPASWRGQVERLSVLGLAAVGAEFRQSQVGGGPPVKAVSMTKRPGADIPLVVPRVQEYR
jgi:hypothetical protein